MADVDVCMVMTTAPDKEQAEKIAMAALEARLAACVQIQAITSYYWWEGKIEKRQLTVDLSENDKRKISSA